MMKRVDPRPTRSVSRPRQTAWWTPRRLGRWAAAAPAAGALCALAQFLGGGAGWLDGRVPLHAAVQQAPAGEAAAGEVAAGEVGELTAKLRSDLPYVRAAVATALGDMGAAARSSTPALVERLQDETPLVRVYAAKALWNIGRHPAAVWTLAEQAAHPDPAVGRLAVYYLGQIGPDAQGALPALRRQLNSGEIAARVHAADALLRIEPDGVQAVDVLLSALHSPRTDVRVLAALALGSAGAAHQARVVPALQAALDDEDGRVQTAAVAGLAAQKSGGVELAAATVAEPAPVESETAASQEIVAAHETTVSQGTATVPDATAPQEVAAVEELMAPSPAAAFDPSAPVDVAPASSDARVAADESTFGVWALPIKVAPPDAADTAAVTKFAPEMPVADPLPVAAPLPVAEYHETAPADRAGPTVAETAPAAATDVRLVLGQLQNDAPEVRREFAARLGRMGSDAQATVPVLEALLADRDPLVRAHAAKALWNVQRQADRCVPVLADLLSSTCPGAAPRAAYTLGRIGPEAVAALPALRSALRTATGLERVAVADAILHIEPNDGDALDALLTDLHDAQGRVRFRAVHALAECPPQAGPRVVPALAVALHDGDEQVRAAARQALDLLRSAAPVAPEVPHDIVVVNQNVLAPFSPDSAKVRELEDDEQDEPKAVYRDVALRELQIRIAPPMADELGQPLELPQDQAAGELLIPVQTTANGCSRPWLVTPYAWTAPAMLYRPLYYEDTYLDRYGYHFGAAQPIVSGADFLWTTFTMPYRLGAYPFHEPRYHLDKCRPGDPAPFQIEFLPLSLKGALYQAAAIAGMSVLAN